MRVLVCGDGPRGRGCSVCALLLAVAMAGCGATERNRTTPSAAGGTPGVGGGASAGSVASAAGAAPELAAVPSDMHRLNSAEYNATVADVLGSGVRLSEAAYDAEIDGFDNISAVLNVSEEQYVRYLETAEEIAHDVFATPASKARVVTCDAQDDAACLRSVIRQTGLRVFRRPLFEAELPVYEKVYAAARARGDLHDAALEQVLVALLASAQFLYRMEFPNGTPGEQPLGPYELASRLSYLLWSSAPDDALLQAAESDALSEDAELATELTRLLADPRSQRFSLNFSGQWLGARRLAGHATDPTTYPEWSPELAAAAATEMYEYFEGFVREDRSWPSFVAGQAHEIDGALAGLYGLTPAASGTRVLLQGERAGYLGSVGFLTLTSLDRRTSPTLRGKTILANLLCQSPPPPPPNVPKLEDTPPTEPRTVRETLEPLWDHPVCGECHSQVDPLGVALEHYDGIGRYRATYPNGELVDSNVILPSTKSFPSPLPVAGLDGLVERVSSDPAFMTCLVRKLYTYGMGRVPAEIDERNIELIASTWQEGPANVKELIRQLVLSTTFRARSDGGLP